MALFAWTSPNSSGIDPASIFSGIVGDNMHPEGTLSVVRLFRNDGMVIELHGQGMWKFPGPAGTPGQGPWQIHGDVWSAVLKSQSGEVLARIDFPTVDIGTFCGSQQSPPYSQTYNAAALTVLLAGNDTVTAGDGDQILAGFNGNDLIAGGRGNDVLRGEGGDDLFVLVPGDGDDVILDFSAGAGTPDKVDLRAHAAFKTFADVLTHATQVGSDTVLDLGGGDSLTFRDVQRDALVAGDFVLGVFAQAALGLDSFGSSEAAGGWSHNELTPRTVGDVDGDGLGDIVGFGGDGTWTALGDNTMHFADAVLALTSFGVSEEAGGWSGNSIYPRLIGDVNGDGRSDALGFGGDGVWVALALGNGTFQAPALVLDSFGASVVAGGWADADTYPRALADVNGDGLSDIIGFGADGVWLAVASGGGAFDAPGLVLDAFGAAEDAGSWISNSIFPRVAADVNGDGRADLIGFGYDGVWVALAQGGTSFAAPMFALASFGLSGEAGGWADSDLYPRLAADVNADGMADLIGFGGEGVWVALASGNGSFRSAALVLEDFSLAQGWTSANQFPRTAFDIDGDGRADLIGFGVDGVEVAFATAIGSYGNTDAIPAHG